MQAFDGHYHLRNGRFAGGAALGIVHKESVLRTVAQRGFNLFRKNGVDIDDRVGLILPGVK